MKESPNLGLHLTSDDDKALNVAQWVQAQSGDDVDSNMMKVDTAVGAHLADRDNPHRVTAAQVEAIPAAQKGTAGGVAELDRDGKVPVGQLPDMDYDPSGSAAAVRQELALHETNISNPHKVTAAQADAVPTSEKGVASGVATLGSDGKVPTTQLPVMDYDPAGSAAVVQANLDGHLADKANPHEVTKAQVGLGNVDNTSDTNKPVSTATQTALNFKANLASPALTGVPTAPTAAGTSTTQIATTEFVMENAPAPAKKLIATFTTSGTFRPADYGLENQYVDVYMVGGGAGGNSGSLTVGQTGGGGGGGGYCVLKKNILLTSSSYAIIVGAGGSGAGPASSGTIGGAGGDTVAFGGTAPGGKPGDVYGRGGEGGNGGGGPGGGTVGTFKGGDGGSFGSCGGGHGGAGGGNISFCPVNPYDNIPYGCGGGGAAHPAGGKGGGAASPLSIKEDAGLGGGGSGGYQSSQDNSLINGGNGGLGGGGGGGGMSPSNGIAGNGGNGGDGIVYIYA